MPYDVIFAENDAATHVRGSERESTVSLLQYTRVVTPFCSIMSRLWVIYEQPIVYSETLMCHFRGKQYSTKKTHRHFIIKSLTLGVGARVVDDGVEG